MVWDAVGPLVGVGLVVSLWVLMRVDSARASAGERERQRVFWSFVVRARGRNE